MNRHFRAKLRSDGGSVLIEFLFVNPLYCLMFSGLFLIGTLSELRHNHETAERNMAFSFVRTEYFRLPGVPKAEQMIRETIYDRNAKPSYVGSGQMYAQTLDDNKNDFASGASVRADVNDITIPTWLQGFFYVGEIFHDGTATSYSWSLGKPAAGKMFNVSLIQRFWWLADERMANSDREAESNGVYYFQGPSSASYAKKEASEPPLAAVDPSWGSEFHSGGGQTGGLGSGGLSGLGGGLSGLGGGLSGLGGGLSGLGGGLSGLGGGLSGLGGGLSGLGGGLGGGGGGKDDNYVRTFDHFFTRCPIRSFHVDTSL